MTDVFFSYSSKDRERVRPIRDALVAEGFEVFWDQEVPPGRNWDEWIRERLDTARCAIVFWSATSVKSDNVVHEATVAKNAGKLIPVLLDPIEAGQFPMGHYTTQGLLWPARGDVGATLHRLREEVEAKAMRRWMRRKLDEAKSPFGFREQLADQEASITRRIATLEAALMRRMSELEHTIRGTREEPAWPQDSSVIARKKPAAAGGSITSWLRPSVVLYLWLFVPFIREGYELGWFYGNNSINATVLLTPIVLILSFVKSHSRNNLLATCFTFAVPAIYGVAAYLFITMNVSYRYGINELILWILLACGHILIIFVLAKKLDASYESF
jgi:hypothetical protein